MKNSKVTIGCILLLAVGFLLNSCCLINEDELQDTPPVGQEVIVDSMHVVWVDDNTLYAPFLSFEVVYEKSGKGQYYPTGRGNPEAIKKNYLAAKNFLQNRQIKFWQIYRYSDRLGFWIDLEPVEERMAELRYGNPPQSDTVYMPPGGSLHKTLGMKDAEALEFAKKFKKDKWRDESGKLIVIVQPGYYVREWRPVEDGSVWRTKIRPHIHEELVIKGGGNPF